MQQKLLPYVYNNSLHVEGPSPVGEACMQPGKTVLPMHRANAGTHLAYVRHRHCAITPCTASRSLLSVRCVSADGCVPRWPNASV
jgi:hypothetical protein